MFLASGKKSISVGKALTIDEYIAGFLAVYKISV